MASNGVTTRSKEEGRGGSRLLGLTGAVNLIFPFSDLQHYRYRRRRVTQRDTFSGPDLFSSVVVSPLEE